MPTQRDTSKELPEIAWRGPFGGIQSELPGDSIEGVGFTDCVNMIFRKSNCTTRPGYTTLPAIPAPVERILGMADFFTIFGVRVQVIMTPTRLIKWDSTAQNWVVIAGPALTGGPAQYFRWTVLNYMLCFSQGNDPVMLWNGITTTYAVAAVTATPGRFLSELAFHLLVGYTFESGVSLPQRLRWTGSFDPTDWTSFNSGFVDLTNDLGPITGIANIYQTGYIFQQRGIVQAIPTGVGTQPFDFVKISNKSKGNIAPYSLDYYGDQMACYVGKDNIYLFDGTQSYPIGDAPMTSSASGSASGRMGARKRIFAELKLADLTQVYGFITTCIGGNDFNAYWLIIPGGSVWVYQFDEACWTRFIFNQQISLIGDFAKQGIPEISQLIGSIADQTWSPATLTGTNPLDDLGIGFNSGAVGDMDFSNFSESSWSITTGQIRYGDSRHNQSTRYGRVTQTDISNTSFNAKFTNELGQSQNLNLNNGVASGSQLIQRIPINIPSKFLTWILSGANPTSFSELALIYDTAEEYRG